MCALNGPYIHIHIKGEERERERVYTKSPCYPCKGIVVYDLESEIEREFKDETP